ncbi:MAG: (2Fe-2S) ferredoxin domain-containing protein [Okeania sp. SIO3I5]|uniref:(2Fe-2S) ferredoxin domain-containing protein n=1 Tax=Okeania sp. SIO3I5 TaxID=2607805 RepID=UPI0013BB8440|nr:(2Fe-2S) ferredoxin domain-containing protein [Okeania sp. SIO3I5]NEQ35082.1 (2Fe-2S) ferredoxin domain-containing protein [Okeania sp. SIO3I5]
MSTSEGQKSEISSGERHIFVCQYHSCLHQNSQEVLKTFEAETKNLVGVNIEPSSCLGQCSIGPTVRIIPDEIWYYRVQPEHIPLIVRQHLKGNKPIDEMLNPRIHPRF